MSASDPTSDSEYLNLPTSLEALLAYLLDPGDDPYSDCTSCGSVNGACDCRYSVE